MLDFKLKLMFLGPFWSLKITFVLVGSSSKSFMRNYMFDFNVLKFFGINTRSGKVLSPLPVR